MENKILEIIKEESENADVRKYTCINGFGYSQFERNIADRVVKLFCQPVVSGQSEQFISLIKELINVGIIDEDDIEVETWVKNYIKEINCH